MGYVQGAWGEVPGNYELVSQRKGFKRYKSPKLVELLVEHAAVLEQREAALSGILQVCCYPDSRLPPPWYLCLHCRRSSRSTVFFICASAKVQRAPIQL